MADQTDVAQTRIIVQAGVVVTPNERTWLQAAAS